MPRILIIDDEESMRHMLSIFLKKEGYDVVAAEEGRQALKVLAGREDFDFILCDIKMPGMDGINFLKELLSTDLYKQLHMPTTIMMSAYGTTDQALECIRLGAYDYISKPFKTDEILLTIKKAEERERLRKDNARLKKAAQEDYDFKNIVSKDSKMLDIFNLIRKVSDYEASVLISGESGTGKELIARAIHYSGMRKERAFVPVNCGAMPEALIESELFGYVKGAFTDAVKNKTGLFQEADEGTIFLDEIGELPRDLQVKLLRVLQEGEVRRVGDSRFSKVDVRVVAATVKDVHLEIKEGRFREDLFYRLNVIPILLPPLRERQGDIELLANHFKDKFAKKFGKEIEAISTKTMEMLSKYQWPGNVRELENVIERAIILEETGTILPESLPFTQGGMAGYSRTMPSFTGLSIKKGQQVLEKDLIEKALEATSGNRTRAAVILEISHRALLYKIKEYGL